MPGAILSPYEQVPETKADRKPIASESTDVLLT